MARQRLILPSDVPKLSVVCPHLEQVAITPSTSYPFSFSRTVSSISHFIFAIVAPLDKKMPQPLPIGFAGRQDTLVAHLILAGDEVFVKFS